MDKELIEIIEKELNTHDKRWMFLKLEFPLLVSKINLEGATSDTASNIYFEFDKHNLLDKLKSILTDKFNYKIKSGERMIEQEQKKIEALADYAHSAWSGWMKYMFSKSTVNNDSSVTIPKELVKRWTRQMNTEYINLPENEKTSDRKEAKEIISILKNV